MENTKSWIINNSSSSKCSISILIGGIYLLIFFLDKNSFWKLEFLPTWWWFIQNKNLVEYLLPFLWSKVQSIKFHWNSIIEIFLELLNRD